MAGVDVAKRRKAFRGGTSWNDATPHGTQLRLRECGKRLGGDKLSPRQNYVQPSLAPTKNVNMFTVTDDWITDHPTKKGGYKAAQLRLIGVSWPPKQGWKRRASGKLITLEDKEKFESYGVKTNRVTGKFVPLCNCDALPWEDCEHTEALAHAAMLEMLDRPCV